MAAFLKGLHSRCSALCAQIQAYSTLLRKIGIHHQVMLSDNVTSEHQKDCAKEAKYLFDESEDNPLPMEIEGNSFHPTENDEDEDAIDTAVANMMDEQQESSDPEDIIIWLPHRDAASAEDTQTVVDRGLTN
jgi:hypothetical protein